MARGSTQYKRRQLGRALFRKAWELAIAFGVGVLTFFAADAINQSQAANNRDLIDAAAKATHTEAGTVQPVIELISHILEHVNFSLQLLLALIMSLIAFIMSELIASIINVKREITHDNLYEADAKVIDLVDTILDATSRFQLAAKSAPKLQSLLSEYLDQRKESFQGFLHRLADLDIDIDSGSETSFTTRLIEIAETNVHAISVDEEEFYSSDKEAAAYLRRQMIWLYQNGNRKIIRIFVAPDTHRTAETEKFNKMMEAHPNILSAIAKDMKGKAAKSAINRYQYMTVKWKDWSRIMKENCDLVIYDETYIRKGILESDESRKAQFRANAADVVEAVMKFKELLAVSSPPESSTTSSGAPVSASSQRKAPRTGSGA